MALSTRGWRSTMLVSISLFLLLFIIIQLLLTPAEGAAGKGKKIKMHFKLAEESRRDRAVKDGRGAEFDKNFANAMGSRQKLNLQKKSGGKKAGGGGKKNKTGKRGKRDVTDQPANDWYDLIYTADIWFGAPPQFFTVLLDTGSANTYVPDASCGPCTDALQNTYYSSDSYDYQADGTGFSIVYGTGGVSGFYGIDDLTLGDNVDNITIINQYFGQATSIDAITILNPYDGVIGLAGPGAFQAPVTPAMQNAISQGLFDQPMFTVYLNSAGPDSFEVAGADFTFGGFDSVNCQTVQGYAPLTLNSWWSFTVTSVSIAGYTSSKDYKVASNTGSVVIYGPDPECKKIWKKAKGQMTKGVRAVRCSKSFNDPAWSINGQVYPVGYKRLIGGPVTSNGKWCQFNIQANPQLIAATGLDWMFGVPWIRHYCQVHDIGNNQIGFALAN